jgi:Bacterial Ig domain
MRSPTQSGSTIHERQRGIGRRALAAASIAGLGLALLSGSAQAAPAGQLSCSIANPGTITAATPVTFTGTLSGAKPPYTVNWSFPDGNPGSVGPTSNVQPGNTTAKTTFTAAGQKAVTLSASDSSPGKSPKTCSATLTVTVKLPLPTARGDTYATPIGRTLTITASPVSGVLYNDFYIDPTTGKPVFNSGLTAVNLDTTGTKGSVSLDTTGAFTYTPASDAADNGNDSFTYQAKDANGNLSNVATVNIHIQSDQPDFKIMMNYELGMHCTGFEFSYCCILPPYNSIVAQVVKPQQPGSLVSNADYPRLLQGDPDNGLDGLGRATVLRDYDDAGDFKKYVLEYYHDAMPRREGNMPTSFNSTAGHSTLISAAEGNSLLYYSTPFDSACTNPGANLPSDCPGAANPKFPAGGLVYATSDHIPNVMQGNGNFGDPTDNFANGWLNHLYIYKNAEGHPNLEGDNASLGVSLEKDKIRLGVTGMVQYPHDCGPSLQPLGPVTRTDPLGSAGTEANDCGGASNGNVLTFSGDKGTIVYTQSNVLENVPITLTAPHIWEALGLPLTPFEDSIGFFANPGAVNEDTIRPFVAMKAALYTANCDSSGNCTAGSAVMGSNGQPVIGFGSAPIDIPNCERCHSAPAYQPDASGNPDLTKPNVNSPNYVRRPGGPDPFIGPSGETLQQLTDEEISYWDAYYGMDPKINNWYARLKGAAINMISMHDYDVGTDFTANYPSSTNLLPGQPEKQASIPQNTRLGHQSVICQRCHGDNVIAALKNAVSSIRPISEAIHDAHRNQSAGGPIMFSDSLGRFGGCQGCHPAHRSDGVMDKYPITQNGDNANADSDNRLGKGGCFVGRDVHSNPLKDLELHGGNVPVNGTDIHLNAVGQWLSQNVFRNQAGRAGSDADVRGIWCTNCHTQLSQEIWRTEDCNDLIHGDCKVNPRAAPNLTTLASMVGLSYQQLINYIDPKNPQKADPLLPPVTSDQTHAPWDPSIPDANIATIEVNPSGNPVLTPDGDSPPDYSVNILSFCTTSDCVNLINAHKTDQSQWRYPANPFKNAAADHAAAVPFSAAAAGRDHWLAAGEPHCADCHAAPYTEQSGNIDFFVPFNYPAKASLMRYSFGHQGISCQGCHESIHGLYPVGAAIDNTTYAQAAALNADGSHGPLKCGTCHQTYNSSNGNGVPLWINAQGNWGSQYVNDFHGAVGFAHQYTAEDKTLVLSTTCENCHGDQSGNISAANVEYLTHALSSQAAAITAGQGSAARTSRLMMDDAELAKLGHILGAATKADGTPNPDEATERTALCSTCHTGGANHLTDNTVACSNTTWLQHLTQGRVSESVWEDVSQAQAGSLCGW